METEENSIPAGGDAGAVTAETLFDEEAEEEARPVVPLRRVGDAGPLSRRARGRLPRNLILALAVIVAGAAGGAVGYLAHMRRAPQPAAEATAGVAPEPDTPRAAVSAGADTSTAAASEAGPQPRPEPPTGVEPERPKLNKVDVRGRDAEEHDERASEAGKPRRNDEDVRVEHQRGDDEKRVERRDEEKRGKPKARLVGTITGGSRP
ncbi:MAG: hypothetical protein ACJ754_13030 [Pyrinomonadaceae bacterium]